MCSTVYPAASEQYSMNLFGNGDNVSLTFRTKTGRECVRGTDVSTNHITMTYTVSEGSPESSCEILPVE